jgi:hypothetical protein
MLSQKKGGGEFFPPPFLLARRAFLPQKTESLRTVSTNFSLVAVTTGRPAVLEVIEGASHPHH